MVSVLVGCRKLGVGEIRRIPYCGEVVEALSRCRQEGEDEDEAGRDGVGSRSGRDNRQETSCCWVRLESLV